MSASANVDADTPVPCSTPNCGFWGRPSTGNFCSRCYKEKTKVNDSPATKNEKETKEQEPKKEAVKTEAKESIQDKIVVENKVEEKAAAEKESAAIEKQTKIDTSAAKPAAATGSDAPEEGSKKRKQKNRMRCFECRKKVGLTGIECSCGYVFCGVHRYPEDHNCDYDFKAEARERYNQKFGGKGAVVDKIIGEKL